MTFQIFCSRIVSRTSINIFYIFLLKPSQQALKRKDSNVHCGSIGRGSNGTISISNSQCLVKMALMRHSLMAVEL